nr:hypothetical transcript [Hymenolepis microstoma]
MQLTCHFFHLCFELALNLYKSYFMDKKLGSSVLLNRDEKLSEVTSELLKRQHQLISVETILKTFLNVQSRKCSAEIKVEKHIKDLYSKKDIFIRNSILRDEFVLREKKKQLGINLSGEWTASVFGNVDEPEEEKCSAPFCVQREDKMDINEIIKAIDLSLHSRGSQVEADFKFRGLIFKKPLCEIEIQNNDYQILNISSFTEDRVDMPSFLKLLSTEINKIDLSSSWILNDFPIDLELTKSGNEMFSFNIVFFVGSPENEIFSKVVEEHCDTDDIPLRLAQANHEISKIRHYFHEIGTQLYDIQTSLRESVGSTISNCVHDYAQNLENIDRREEEAEREILINSDQEVTRFNLRYIPKLNKTLSENAIKTENRIKGAFVASIKEILVKLHHQRIAELNNWQKRVQLIDQLFETMENQYPNSSVENSNNAENIYQLPLFKPPSLKILDQAPEKPDKTKSKRRPTSRMPPTKSNVPDAYSTPEGSSPKLVFVTNEGLSSDELLKLIGVESQLCELKKSRSVRERKAATRHSERAKRKPIPPQLQPNHYLLGSLSKLQGEEKSFLIEVSICSLEIVRSKLTEEQTKLGLSVDENGNEIIPTDDSKKSRDTSQSRSSKTNETLRKKVEMPKESSIEVDNFEEMEVGKKTKLSLLKNEAERVAFRLQLICKVGVNMLMEFDNIIADFQDEATKWIEMEYYAINDLVRRFEKYAWAKTENGEYLKHQILIGDDQSFAKPEDETIFEAERLPMINPLKKSTEGEHLEPDPLTSLSKLKSQLQEEAPSGIINQKRFFELLSVFESCKALEVVRRFTIPHTDDFKSTGHSETSFVDWKRYFELECMNYLNMTGDQLWMKLRSLRKLDSMLNKGALIGVCLQSEVVRKCMFGEGCDPIGGVADLFLSLYEGKAVDGTQNIKLHELIIFMATFIAKSPIEGLIRSMNALLPPTCELLDEQSYQDLVDIFNSVNDMMICTNDFAASIEVTEEVLNHLQTKRIFVCVGSINTELHMIFAKYGAKEIPIRRLLCDSQFHSLCERLIA